MALTLAFRSCLNNVCHSTRNTIPQIGATAIFAKRYSCSPVEEEIKNDSNSVAISTDFINRNPRNLEFLGLAWKRKGWRFQYPSKNFYNRVVLVLSNRHTEAYLEHCSGSIVVSCSTKEAAIRKHLYKATDLAAISNLGKIFAQRCIESGIEDVSIMKWESTENSEKFQTFGEALEDAGLNLREPAEMRPPYMPGIDYDDTEKVQELIERQSKVWALGDRSLLVKWIKDKRRKHGRKRPILQAYPMEMPSYNFYS